MPQVRLVALRQTMRSQLAFPSYENLPAKSSQISMPWPTSSQLRPTGTRKIDEKPDVDKIDDETIGEIRRSRLLVADFTHGSEGPRGGVY